MKFFRLLALFVLACIPILIFSCKKTTQIGSSVLPIGDFIFATTTDTFTVLSQEETELPVATNNLSNYLMGCMKDPIFGTSYAAIFTQVGAPGGGGGASFGDSIRVDSIVLSLPYYSPNPYYGIPKIPQSIKVYQVTQSMVQGVTYYSNQPFSFNPQPIGVKNNYVPDFIDSPILSMGGGVYDTVPPQLRIRLTAAFAQELLSQSGTGTLLTNSTFQNFLKGILIAPDTTSGFGGGIMYFDMTTAQILLYCKYISSVKDSVFNFPISYGSNNFVTTNYFKHNYTGTPVQTLLKSTATNDSVLYLQSMGGLRAKVTIPYLKNLGNNVLINKAQLEVVQLYRNPTIVDSNFSAPHNLEVLTDSLNTNYFIEDISNEFLNYGGTRIKTPLAANDTIWEYNVNVSDQVQYMLTGNPTNSSINYSQFSSLFLRTFPNPDIADRIVVGGGNANKYKLVLHLVYTKLK